MGEVTKTFPISNFKVLSQRKNLKWDALFISSSWCICIFSSLKKNSGFWLKRQWVYNSKKGSRELRGNCTYIKCTKRASAATNKDNQLTKVLLETLKESTCLWTVFCVPVYEHIMFFCLQWLVLNTSGVPQVQYQLQQHMQQYLAIYSKKKILRILNVTVKSFSHIWLKFLSDTVQNRGFMVLLMLIIRSTFSWGLLCCMRAIYHVITYKSLIGTLWK